MSKGYYLIQALCILTMWLAHGTWGRWERLQGRQSSAMLFYGCLATDLFLVD